LAIVNNAAINMGVQVALLYPGAHYFRCMPRSVIIGSYGISIFSFLRNLHTAFHSGCINLHSHQQCIRALFPPPPRQHLLLFVLLMTAILTGVRWNLNLVLICISFMAKDTGHYFICLLAICTSFEEKNSCTAIKEN
jgi:hypothetical protein